MSESEDQTQGARVQGPKRGRWRLMLMLGGLVTVAVPIVIASVIFFRPPKPLDNLLNEELVRQFTGVHAQSNIFASFRDGFEGVSASAAGTTKIDRTVRPDGSSFYAKVQPGGNTVTTELDVHGRIISVKGTIKLSDGRKILFDRIYRIKDKNGQSVVEDKSVITDSWGRELRNDLVETRDFDGRTLSVKGVMRNSSGWEFKVNRTYTYSPSSLGGGVKHKDEE